MSLELKSADRLIYHISSANLMALHSICSLNSANNNLLKTGEPTPSKNHAPNLTKERKAVPFSSKTCQKTKVAAWTMQPSNMKKGRMSPGLESDGRRSSRGASQRHGPARFPSYPCSEFPKSGRVGGTPFGVSIRMSVCGLHVHLLPSYRPAMPCKEQARRGLETSLGFNVCKDVLRFGSEDSKV